MSWKPELLAPAKNLERLKVAILYGADAVYVGGQKYGLRARADNFTDYELEEAATFAHQHGAKLYVTLNAFLHDEDFAGFEAYCGFLETIGIDAVIVSDLGVLRKVRQSSKLAVHLSTQASCLNGYAAQAWQSFGVERLIVGRELTIAEGGQIRQQAGIEVEMFTHGAMCMAYSGHCTISNFTAGRDSNRGGCSQSCRFPYDLQSNHGQIHAQPIIPLHETQSGVTFMSSTDLWGIRQIGQFFEHRICSLKIEGRMKSSLYVATTCRVYRQLIDAYAAGRLDESLLQAAAAELQAIPHRDYATGSLDAPAGQESIYGQLSGINTGSHKYLGLVLETTPQEIIMRLVEPLQVGDEIELLPFHHAPIHWPIQTMRSIVGKPLDKIRKDSVVCLPKTEPLQSVQSLNVVRMSS